MKKTRSKPGRFHQCCDRAHKKSMLKLLKLGQTRIEEKKPKVSHVTFESDKAKHGMEILNNDSNNKNAMLTS